MLMSLNFAHRRCDRRIDMLIDIWLLTNESIAAHWALDGVYITMCVVSFPRYLNSVLSRYWFSLNSQQPSMSNRTQPGRLLHAFSASHRTAHAANCTFIVLLNLWLESLNKNPASISTTKLQARFYVGAGGQMPPNLGLAPNVTWNTVSRTQSIDRQVQKEPYVAFKIRLNVSPTLQSAGKETPSPPPYLTLLCAPIFPHSAVVIGRVWLKEPTFENWLTITLCS